MATRMLQRRGTAAQWASQNPVLASGELGFETDSKIIKVGDGVTPWNSLSLPYVPSAGGTMTGPLTLVAPTQPNHAARRVDVEDSLKVTGTNANGRFFRLGSLLVCIHDLLVPGNSTNGVTWTYPRQFGAQPSASAFQDLSSTQTAVLTSIGTTGVVVRVREISSAAIVSSDRPVKMIAIGLDS